MALRLGVQIIITTTDENNATGTEQFDGAGEIGTIQALREADEALTKHLDYNKNQGLRDLQDGQASWRAQQETERQAEIEGGRHGQDS